MSGNASGARPFTTRLPQREYEALKAYAFFTGSTLGDIVLQAVREFLVNHGRDTAVETAVEERRRRFLETLERLTEP